MEDLLYRLLLGGAALAFFSLGFYLGYLSGYGVGKLHRHEEAEQDSAREVRNAARNQEKRR